jgi:IS605 OrfB family transposase
MKLTAKVKLQPTEAQADSLKRTLETANEACNYISEIAWNAKTFGQFQIHRLVYADVRAKFGLSAQLTVRCIAKVTDAYKPGAPGARKTKRTFKPHGAVPYDDRILYWQTDNQVVSIWTLDGRQRMGYLAGDKQRQMLVYRSGESDLIYNKQKDCFYLLATCDIPDPDGEQVEDFLGVDLGEKNIATTSDGEIHTAETIERNRLNHQRMRDELQAKGTKSTRRKLKRLAGKQRRFQTDINHQISKRLVADAKRTKRGIALEDLTHIRQRTRVNGKEQRAKRSNWSFAQLGAFIEYKAKMAGILVEVVDPAYTSQRCFVCGHIEKANRKSQGEFLCCSCGHMAHADVNAAKNISGLASTSLMSRQYRQGAASGTSPTALALGS